MKEPWQIFADEYRRSAGAKEHALALGDAMTALAYHLIEMGVSDHSPLVNRFTIAAHRWHEEGGGDWSELREKLRHEWVDHELAE